MGLFSRKSENQINEMPQSDVVTLKVYGSHGTGNRGLAYLWMVLQTIFDGMRNVRFTVEERYDSERAESLIRFVEHNFNAIVWQWWSLGFACIGVDDSRGKWNYYIPRNDRIKRGSNGEVTNFDIVEYSERYMFSRKSALELIMPSLSDIDTYKAAERYMTENFGALGILTGKGVGANQGEREDFEAKLKSKYGITADKSQILLTTLPLDFSQMTLPVEQLKLTDKIREEVKLVCGFFNVPYDLIPFSGQSTYANQEQAVVNFYRNCISPLAEVALNIIRYAVRKDRTMMIPSSAFSFCIDNVAELADDRTAEMEYKLKAVELVERMRALGLDTTKEEEELR